MMKKLCCVLAALLIAATASAGICESLYVDNRETDKVYPERLNLRDAPNRDGGMLGLYYTGTQVDVLGVEGDYTKVSVGGIEGYMASEYLITMDEAEKRYGAESGFGKGRDAVVDLTGMWLSDTPLLEGARDDAAVLARLTDETAVEVLGVLDNWAYIAADVNGTRTLGYVDLDVLTDVGAYKVMIVAGKKADSKTTLYAAPNGKAIMDIKNGTACFNVFGRKEGSWIKVRVGGVTGYVKGGQSANLKALQSDEARKAIPYYPLMMQTKDDVLLYHATGDDDAQYITLGKGMKIELLAEADDYAYVRTYEGGVGAYHVGDFGYVKLSDLTLTDASASVGIAQADNGDVPVVLLAKPEKGAKMIGALCPGAQVRIVDYTQTDYVKVKLEDVEGYIPKSEIRMLSGGETVSERIPQRAIAKEDFSLCVSPDKKGNLNVSVTAGERVYMLGVCDGWAYVQAAASVGLNELSDEQDRTGFVQLDVLNAPMSSTHLTAVVNTDKVNMRTEPSSTTGDIIAKARTGELLRVADYGADWTCVVTPAGKRGYVMTKYLEFDD